MPFAILCVTIIIGSLVAVLLLNTTMAAGAYEARDLLIETANLMERRADLLLELDEHASPQSLADKALALGMHPATEVGYISLEDGTVRRAGGRG
ncbi:MAG: hypothetical protein JW722_00895 [Demequinaceae bacterium]|nr:hypothetical protein [Demequinaceae bacterium]